MAEYNVYLTQTMSRTITVKAETHEELLAGIEEEMYFNVNSSNDFEAAGEVEIYSIETPDGLRVDPTELYNEVY